MSGRRESSDLFPEISAEAQRIADAVKAVITPGRGFICFAFDFEKVAVADGRRAARFGYVSNAHRGDALQSLVDFLEHKGVLLPGSIEPVGDIPRVVPDNDPRQLLVIVTEDMPITCLVADKACMVQVTSVPDGQGCTVRAVRTAAATPGDKP